MGYPLYNKSHLQSSLEANYWAVTLLDEEERKIDKREKQTGEGYCKDVRIIKKSKKKI